MSVTLIDNLPLLQVSPGRLSAAFCGYALRIAVLGTSRKPQRGKRHEIISHSPQIPESTCRRLERVPLLTHLFRTNCDAARS